MLLEVFRFFLLISYSLSTRGLMHLRLAKKVTGKGDWLPKIQALLIQLSSSNQKRDVLSGIST